MPRHLDTTITSFPIAGEFKISRGSKTSADVVICTIWDGNARGRGECVPYKRYGETLDSVTSQIVSFREAIERGANRSEIAGLMPPGAARNAVDCALWDLEAKISGQSVAAAIGVSEPKPLTTAYTISLDTADAMAAQAGKYAHRALLKVKTGTEDDETRIRAVRAAAPLAAIVLDANEGWSEDNVVRHLQIAAECGVALVEQPLPAGHDDILARIAHPLLICADESVHARGDLSALVGKYDAVNIKLDKTGGLTEALAMKAEARRLGFSIMAGCMVGSSLAMAPAVLLAQDVDFVDLDGPLLLAEDCEPALTYRESLVYPPERVLWG
ncbi:dipeptide epimerase [Rhizobium sp. KVB221]|uniref:Dipeptide epimerase n=1 Tax=Rhizobium setariae TaxID=2801340 RepID=A0A936YTJ3_9HYPH|nr:N-acetyl-D-Glu racemase DgcA [Rhizobium setariae]MBL0372751.1 dipeptide epimerase [Rhizobium setariae]